MICKQTTDRPTVIYLVPNEPKNPNPKDFSFLGQSWMVQEQSVDDCQE